MAKLVAIGDSLTQGFQSAAVTHVDLSYPAMIARCMGLDVLAFRTPDFTGSGGLPCNLEWIARQLAHRFDGHIGTFEWPAAFYDIVELLDEVEDYWERGHGNQAGADALYHNLAVWGFETGDAYNITAGEAHRIATTNVKDDWFQPPSEPRMRTAWRVLNPALDPARNADTQIAVARRIKERDGTIEHLVVWLGANNCLGTILELDATQVTSDEPPGPFSGKTLWTPKAFATEYARLAAEIAQIGAERVVVATIPHVTIAPIAKGIMKNRGRLPVGEKYFDYYTRFFIEDDVFDPGRDKHLTKEDAQRIDSYIDEYNESIRSEAKQRGFFVADMCQVLDDLAVKRNQGRPRYVLPPPIADLDVRFLEVAPTGTLRQGGLFSLDGVHPTTCGYAIIAREFIRVMNANRPEGAPAIPEPDYAALREIDSLVSYAPGTLHDMEAMLAFLERRFHVTRWLSPSASSSLK